MVGYIVTAFIGGALFGMTIMALLYASRERR